MVELQDVTVFAKYYQCSFFFFFGPRNILHKGAHLLWYVFDVYMVELF